MHANGRRNHDTLSVDLHARKPWHVACSRQRSQLELPMPELTDTRTQPYSGFDQVFIGGRWLRGGSDRANQDLNPWTGEILADIPQASRDDLDEAYASARDAQRGWAAMLPSERAAVMRRAASV